MKRHLLPIAGSALIGVALGVAVPHIYQPWQDGRDPIRVHATTPPTGEPTLTAAQRQSLADRHAALIAALPYYGQDAPDDCYEDMVCWIGTSHDGRDDNSIIADLPHDITAAATAYPDLGTWGWDNVTPEYADTLAEGLGDGDDTRQWEACWIRVADTTVVVCPDGTVVTS